ncbi:methyltransferase domain-containing protein [Streptomyces tubbatahanensis]|uniref:Methyltransferase domain-containing protein n=1 Tax=Streptomyces tubbatahanensis TaxID=2923272 RepID=A0ABY3Y1B1_9ACTN|nr:class I SAM-dependent methyltransferase [Streptomyces tubbatahanensis]UNT00622.1 methyltransferase domain-containing protein [Streptomyces tubbatahanensis]
MATTELDEARYCADTFNGAIASAAISAAWELGLLDELEQQGVVDIADYARRHDTHPEALLTLVVALSSRHVVDLDADRTTAKPGAGFRSAYLTKGFFHWLTRGCGELFTTLPTKIKNADRVGTYVRRDARAISVACRNIARTFFDPPFRELIDDLDIGTVADLGCGSADRIVWLAGLRPQIDAIGIDVAEGAIAVSKEAIAQAGLEERVSLVQDDVLNLTPREEYADVDLVTCFLMGHDFWPRENCVRTLRRLRTVFPNVKNLVLGDTCRSTGLAGPDYPMFSLGFETVHGVMDQFLPSLDEWTSVLEESGWRCADRRMIDLPAFSFVYRLTPA